MPRNWTDAAYYEPLKNMEMDEQTKLYLGLVLAHDGEGALERIEMAQEVYGGALVWPQSVAWDEPQQGTSIVSLRS